MCKIRDLISKAYTRLMESRVTHARNCLTGLVAEVLSKVPKTHDLTMLGSEAAIYKKRIVKIKKTLDDLAEDSLISENLRLEVQKIQRAVRPVCIVFNNDLVDELVEIEKEENKKHMPYEIRTKLLIIDIALEQSQNLLLELDY